MYRITEKGESVKPSPEKAHASPPAVVTVLGSSSTVWTRAASQASTSSAAMGRMRMKGVH